MLSIMLKILVPFSLTYSAFSKECKPKEQIPKEDFRSCANEDLLTFLTTEANYTESLFHIWTLKMYKLNQRHKGQIYASIKAGFLGDDLEPFYLSDESIQVIPVGKIDFKEPSFLAKAKKVAKILEETNIGLPDVCETSDQSYYLDYVFDDVAKNCTLDFYISTTRNLEHFSNYMQCAETCL